MGTARSDFLNYNLVYFSVHWEDALRLPSGCSILHSIFKFLGIFLFSRFKKLFTKGSDGADPATQAMVGSHEYDSLHGG
jgi:hypothetical protein